MATITAVTPGTKVRATYIPGITDSLRDETYTGQTVSVIEYREEYPYTGRDSKAMNGPVCFADFADGGGYTRRYYFSEWEVIDENPDPEKPMMPEPKQYVRILAVSTTDKETNDRLKGKIGVVYRTSPAGSAYIYDDNEDRFIWQSCPTITVMCVDGEPSTTRHSVTNWEIMPRDWEAPADMLLRRQIVTLTLDNERLSTVFGESMDIISTTLNDEAESRGWCSEYDRIVADINGDLPGPYYLRVREQEVEVVVTRTRTVTETTTVTITMAADGDLSDYHDDIVEAAENDYDWTTDDEEIDNYEYEIR